MTTLLGHWTGVGTTNDNVLEIPIDQTIPAGSRLILVTNKSAVSTNGVSSIINNDEVDISWFKEAHSCRSNTHDMSIHSAPLGASLNSGNALNVVFTDPSTRKIGILTAWSDLGSPLSTSGNSSYGPAATSVGPNGSSASESATAGTDAGLVIGVFSRAGANTVTPADTLIASIITAGGSSERGIAMSYRLDAGAGAKTVTGTLSGSQGWAAMAAIFDATAPEPSAEGYAVVGGAKKSVANRSVIIGGSKKSVVNASVIIGGMKKSLP